MKTKANSYLGYRFPPEVISHGVWLYYRFSLSLRDAAKRFFRKLLKGQGSRPWQLVADKLRSYDAAYRNIMPSVDHNTERYANNLAEVSHQLSRKGVQARTPPRTP